MEKFHEKLKVLRKKQGLTQNSLSNMLNISQGAYANWESGKRQPSYEILSMLACIFDVSIDFLLSEYIEISKERLLKLKAEREKMKVFPKRLKELRKKKKLTQIELGEKVGVKQSAYGKWENGKCEPNLETLLKLASILNTTTSYLLGEKNEVDC